MFNRSYVVLLLLFSIQISTFAIAPIDTADILDNPFAINDSIDEQPGAF